MTLGYDPTDQNSFPYQKSDPPFSKESLVFDPDVLENASNLELKNYFMALINDPYYDGDNGYRTIDMALRLFVAAVNDPDHLFDGVAYPDLFAACLDQAFIWEVG